MRGRAHRAAGRYGEAERELRLALDGAAGAERVAVLNELGMTLKYAGRPAEAASAYREALALGGPHAADLLHNLGGAAHAAGDHATALRHAREGLDLRVRSEGEDSIAVALDRAALAAILIDLGQPAEAASILTAVLAAYRRAGEHHETAVTLHNLGAALYAMGDRDRARIALREALETKEAVLGPDHPELAVTLYNLARVDDAAHLLERCVSVLAGKVADTHPVLAAARRAIAMSGP
ncbi:tetratricopeptide repeat protein [Nonomuraea sp. NPDC050556]|uniref:tetratricopeptide repeat protein n=1 Tax=Nonomuraea sp. NPDC050556 TaxID=3364369 RepID=UPI0037B463EE